MKLQILLMLAFAAPLHAQVKQEALTLDDLLESGRQFLQENLDEDWLRVLQEFDEKKVQELLRNLQHQFQGEYVIDLAALKRTAATALPPLESHAETLEYAMWLRTRMEYLDVADELRVLVPAPKVEPGQPPKPPPKSVAPSATPGLDEAL